MFILGLTGSIGMGKSTTAAMFRAAGVPVHDSDATVHKLYAGELAPLIEAAFPGTVHDGKVDRTRLAAKVLGAKVFGQPNEMLRLEAIVHPFVRGEEKAFLDRAISQRAQLVVLDIPLLFETKGETCVDGVLVVTAPAAVQRTRVLSRPGMTVERFDHILARQMPDAEKRQRAHFILDTDHGLSHATKQVQDMIRALSGVTGRLGIGIANA